MISPELAAPSSLSQGALHVGRSGPHAPKYKKICFNHVRHHHHVHHHHHHHSHRDFANLKSWKLEDLKLAELWPTISIVYRFPQVARAAAAAAAAAMQGRAAQRQNRNSPQSLIFTSQSLSSSSSPSFTSGPRPSSPQSLSKALRTAPTTAPSGQRTVPRADHCDPVPEVPPNPT